MAKWMMAQIVVKGGSNEVTRAGGRALWSTESVLAQPN